MPGVTRSQGVTHNLQRRSPAISKEFQCMGFPWRTMVIIRRSQLHAGSPNIHIMTGSLPSQWRGSWRPKCPMNEHRLQSSFKRASTYMLKLNLNKKVLSWTSCKQKWMLRNKFNYNYLFPLLISRLFQASPSPNHDPTEPSIDYCWLRTYVLLCFA